MKRFLFFLIFTLLLVPAFIPASFAGDGRSRGKESCAEESAVSSSFSYDEKTTRLTMSFEEDELKKSEPEKARNFKRRKFFRVNEAFELPRELCEALGTTGPILIKCGNYPLEYKDGTYTITLISGM